MAQPGTYTAYRQLKPLEGDVSQDIQQQEENGFKRRALQSAEDRTAIEKADREARNRKDVLDGIKGQNPYDTGSKSKNEFLVKMFSNASKEFGPLMKVLENPSAYSEQEVADAQVKYNNLNQLAENTKRFDEIVTSEYTAYQKNLAARKIRPNPEFEKNYQAGYGNKIGGIDAQGLPIVYFLDENNDGIDDVTGKKGTVGDYESYSELVSGTNKKYDFKPVYDMGDELLADSKNLQGQANDKAMLSGYVNNQLFKADGKTPTAKLESFAQDAGITDLTNTAALQQIANNYTNMLSVRVKPDTAQQALEQKIKQDAIANELAQKRLDQTESEGEKNRASTEKARTQSFAAAAAGTTSITTETMDADGNVTSTTVRTPNKPKGGNAVPKGSSNKKTYSSTQESAIKAAMKSNPGYTREEIITALKL